MDRLDLSPLGFELPPGASYADLDAATDRDDGAPPGACLPCFEEGLPTQALPGTDRCEECT